MSEPRISSASLRHGIRIALGLLICLSGSEAGAQVIMLHEPIECLPRNRHTVLKASVLPETAESPRLYFRAGDEETLYFVDMVLEDGRFQAALPRPDSRTQRVTYSIRVSDALGDARTSDHAVEVVASDVQCSPGNADAAYFSGDDPAIVLRSTAKGASPLAPGFEPDGVKGFEAAPASDGDDKMLTWVGIGSAVVAGSSIGVLAGSSESAVDTTTLPSPPPVATPPPPTGPSVPPPPTDVTPTIACFDADPTVMLGQQIRLDASCSSPRGALEYEWDLGDGRHRTGRVVNPVYRTPGTYDVELTVRQGASDSPLDADRMTRQIEVRAEPAPVTPSPGGGGAGSADLGIEIVGLLTPRGPTAFGITYFITITNFGPGEATGVTVTDPFPPTLTFNVASGASCSMAGSTLTCDLSSLPAFGSKTLTFDVTASGVTVGDTILNTVTVAAATGDPRLANNTRTSAVQIVFSQKTPDAAGPVTTSFISSLEGWSTNMQGNVLSNGRQLDAVQSSSPFQHQVEGVVGRNRLEAYLQSSSEAEGVWRFDFSRTELFVGGSFEVRRGRVLTQSSHEIVFQLHGNPGERIEFTYRLAE